MSESKDPAVEAAAPAWPERLTAAQAAKAAPSLGSVDPWAFEFRSMLGERPVEDFLRAHGASTEAAFVEWALGQALRRCESGDEEIGRRFVAAVFVESLHAKGFGPPTASFAEHAFDAMMRVGAIPWAVDDGGSILHRLAVFECPGHLARILEAMGPRAARAGLAREDGSGLTPAQAAMRAGCPRNIAAMDQAWGFFPENLERALAAEPPANGVGAHVPGGFEQMRGMVEREILKGRATAPGSQAASIPRL